jgi:hypothetical protein
VCCAVGADGGAFGVLPVGVCGWPQVTSFDGTRCASSCPSGTTRVCESQAACTVGTTCTPLRTRGVELGLCL